MTALTFQANRIDPSIQMNIPGHALGTLAAIVIKALSEGDLAKLMRTANYSQARESGRCSFKVKHRICDKEQSS
ncbi:MAG: hypothetical protein QFX40_03875 [Archaeoglobales archaeon]|nr:hypothetical protein [Archaeoglobales archaeon]